MTLLAKRPSRLFAFWAVAIFVSFLLHVFIAANVCCPTEPLGVDGINYEKAATQLLTTKNILDPLFLDDKAYWPPLWPLVLTLLYSIFGHDLFVARVFLSLLVTQISIFTFLLAREQFDNKTGVIASLFIAYSPTFFIYATLHNYEVVIADLLIVSLFLVIHSHHLSTARREFGVLLIAGILFGLGILTKAILLAFLPFIVIWELVQKGKTLHQKIARSFVFTLLAFLTVLPWTARNYLVYRELILVNSNGDANFEIGNNLYASGGYWIPPEWEWASFKQSKGNPLTRGLGFIRDNPERFLELAEKKIELFWSAEPVFYFANDVIQFEPLTTWGREWLGPHNGEINEMSIIIFSVGAGISILASMNMIRKRLISYLVILCYSIIHVAIIGEPRFRVPIYPWIAIFQGYAFACFIRLSSSLKDQILPWVENFVMNKSHGEHAY
ncbi:MAG: glycosyltransferase family 39 protein [Chloroflexi bacterium]|nr:glycosyltransferase family 39 protein [Chloroflexota bacterium]